MPVCTYFDEVADFLAAVLAMGMTISLGSGANLLDPHGFEQTSRHGSPDRHPDRPATMAMKIWASVFTPSSPTTRR
jgi:hypothetical protein